MQSEMFFDRSHHFQQLLWDILLQWPRLGRERGACCCFDGFCGSATFVVHHSGTTSRYICEAVNNLGLPPPTTIPMHLFPGFCLNSWSEWWQCWEVVEVLGARAPNVIAILAPALPPPLYHENRPPLWEPRQLLCHNRPQKL